MNIYYSDHQPWKWKWISKSLDAVKVEGDITCENKSEHKSLEVNKMLKSQVDPDESQILRGQNYPDQMLGITKESEGEHNSWKVKLPLMKSCESESVHKSWKIERPQM